jgi:aspartyl-tRNA(Asn)/glutamyl-tRNA(Gln) amidotransferase subunit C
MKLTKEEVEHIAKLARLGISEEEKEKFSEQLSSILEYIEQLKEVDTDEIPPTAQVTDLENVMAMDIINECDPAAMKKIIESAPMHDDSFVKVRGVFE